MTDEPLNQETVDALLQQVDAGGAGTSAPDAGGNGAEPADGAGAAAGIPPPAAPGRDPEGKAAAVGVRPALFSPLRAAPAAPGPSSINLLLDVPLQVTVELGRTHLSVREVLGLGAGSVVELEKLAGEPIDLLVNNRLIARGEVVVIDESFGVRVTEIVRPSEGIAAHR